MKLPDDQLARIPQGGPHVVVGRLPDRRWCAVAAVRVGALVTVITVGSGKTRKEAVADCRQDLHDAMLAYVTEFGVGPSDAVH